MGRRPTTDPQKYYVPGEGWRVTIAGKQRRLGKDEGQAEAKRRRLVGEWLLTGTAKSTEPPVPHEKSTQPATVASVLAEYLDRGLRPSLSAKQRDRIVAAVRAVLESGYGEGPAADFGALELKRVRAALVRRRPRKKRNHKNAPEVLARRYINSLIGCIKTAWDWCGSERLVPAWRAHELRTVKALQEDDGGRETDAVLPPPPGDVEKALAKMQPPPSVMVELQRLTGMRPGEVRRMKRGEVSTSPAEILHPPHALPTAAFKASDGTLIWVFAPQKHKTRRKRKPRLIAFGPACQELLRPFVEQASGPDDYLFRPADAARGRKPGGKPPGPCYSPGAYGNAIRRACRRAGVPVWRPSQLRHFVATEIFADDPLTAMSVLGHSHIAMSAHYATVNLRRAGEHAAKAG